MTRQKHLKQLVRERMERTGERYATARRQVVGAQVPHASHPTHLPGSIPLPAALRVLLTHAGVRHPDGTPLSEALTFALAGGIGAGVFAFHYEEGEFSSFYIAGRHLWWDDLLCLTTACQRLGITPIVKESGSATSAERALAEATAHGPVIAWVDMAGLPHRGMPASWSGGGYHLVTVYRADPGGDALIGDLADEPISLPTATLTAARGRIKKDKHRILSIPAVPRQPDLRPALTAAVAATREGLLQGKMKNFTLAAFDQLAERLHGTSGKESWERIFPPGHRLWRGLTSMHDFIEYYGTGGGLCRPLFADALREMAPLVKRQEFIDLADEYAVLGAAWSELADAALPAEVPLCLEARQLFRRKAELVLSGPDGREDASAAWSALEALATRCGPTSPFDATSAATLREELQGRVHTIAAGERRLVAGL